MLSFFHLTVFEAMMRLKSVTLAAEALDLPQSSLSRNLQVLRDHFGDSLFIRTRAGMEPTSLALSVAPGITEALELYTTRLSGRGQFDPAESRRNFSIAASDIGHLTIFPSLQRHAAGAPNVQFTAVSLGRAKLISQLESGEVDLAIGGFPNLYANIREQTLLREEYVCIVPKRFATDGRLSLARFKSSQHIVVDGRHLGHIHQEVEKQVVCLAGRQNVRIISESFLMSAHLATQSDLILTVPGTVARILHSDRTAITLPPVDLPGFDIKQYWHERFDHDPGNMWLRSVIARIRHQPGNLDHSDAPQAEPASNLRQDIQTHVASKLEAAE